MRTFTQKRQHRKSGNVVFVAVVVIGLLLSFWAGYRLGRTVASNKGEIPKANKVGRPDNDETVQWSNVFTTDLKYPSKGESFEGK